MDEIVLTAKEHQTLQVVFGGVVLVTGLVCLYAGFITGKEMEKQKKSAEKKANES